MLKKVFIIFGQFIVVLSILGPKNYNASSEQFQRQLPGEDFDVNETEVNNNNTVGSNAANETLFWTVPNTEDITEITVTETDVQETAQPEDEGSVTTEENIKESTVTTPTISADEPTSEDKTQEVAPQVSDEINDKIILQRNKCHAEIAIHENSDTKLELKFGNLLNNSHGTCHITLTGRGNAMLGVVISNIHLFRNNTQGEVLKVFVGDNYSAFVLKEYYGYDDYEPLLLTETNKVYLILYYKVDYMVSNEDYTHFNLHVFTYHKDENNVDNYKEPRDNYNQFYYSNEAFSGEETPYFTPYIYHRVY